MLQTCKKKVTKNDKLVKKVTKSHKLVEKSNKFVKKKTDNK